MLYLHHSNCLNQLIDILLEKLTTRQTGVLNTEQILVQNPGMKRWLQQQISLSCGIAANFQFPLPSRFIWDIFLAQFDDVDSLSAYDGEVLRWRLMTLLKNHSDDRPLKLLKRYLQQDESGLASFQLAEKMAALYDQYLVYRPEMIRHWEQGQQGKSSAESWQSYLWRLLREQNSQPHRAELVQRLVELLLSDRIKSRQLPERLFVFAISAMSPLYMNVLAALGQQIDVHIFNLNPCEHYWGDIQSKRDQIKQGTSATPSQAITGNELLASLGKQGRDYIDQFYDSPFEFDDNHQFREINPDSLLNCVKYDILHLTRMKAEFDPDDDQSIQIVSCYSELRELQVLYDRLLDLLAKDKSLQAHDIVVMCPDINTLAPYIEAVFGEQPDHKKIPFSISDHNVLASTPLFQAILDWIRLPSSRLTANEVLSWLELPALQRTYGLDDQAVETIRYWIKTNHIHWGLDRDFKQQLGMSVTSINTWLSGINRLMTAYIMNDGVELFEGQVASDSIMSNSEFQALGQLQKFLDDLFAWSERLRKPAGLDQWQQNINELIANFLALDEEEEWLLKPLRDEIANWQLQALQAEFVDSVNAALIHHILQNAITEGTTHNHYLTGGINFCNLIPMRTLPFRVVCLIGMGDDLFPRAEIPLQLDLISMNPQKGDRSRREDDRYMFLQSMLSAKDVFYISYVGQNKKDDSSIEPSVVVTELVDYVEQTTGYRLPIIKTALQVFSSKNFEQGSYAEQWQILSNYNTPEAFAQTIETAKPQTNIQLDELIAFYKNPARFFMEKSLNMSLSEYQEGIDDDEIFALGPLEKYKLNNKLLNDLFDKGEVDSEKYLQSGELAEQSSGVIQFGDLHQQVFYMYQQINEHAAFTGHFHFDASLALDTIEIHGQVESYSNKGLLQFNQSTLKGKTIFSYWVQHCFLCATENIELTEFFCKDKYKKYKWRGFTILSVEKARQILQLLLDGFTLGKQQLLPFYVDTAYEYETEKHKTDEQTALKRIQARWKGDDFNPFYEALDIYTQTSLKNSTLNADCFDPEFFTLSSRYMSPLLDNMEDRA